MTRRTLYIIIAMLAIIDLVAGLYYLGARMENEGKSIDLFNSRDDTAIHADTLTAETIADEVAPMRVRERAYITGDSDRRIVSGMEVRMRRVIAVNGNDSLDTLDRAIAAAAFGATGESLDIAIGSFLSTPYWGGNYVSDMRQVDYAATLMHGVPRYVTTVSIAPCMTSHRLLVIETRRDVKTATDTVTTTAYVHYDRLSGRVLQRHDIISADKEQRLLNLINEKIGLLNRTKPLHLTAATRVPASFRATRQGLLFNFAEGELTGAEHGGIEVRVDYTVLGGCLTESFKHLLWHNSEYRNL